MTHRRSVLRSILPLLLLLTGTTLAAEPALEVLRCETLWDVPAAGDEFLLGGLLVDAGWNQQGELCVVDYVNRDLKIFGPDGEYRRTLGREGEGPGEVTDARQLVVHDDGRLGLLQKFPAKVVWLRPDGDPGGELTLVNTLEGDGGKGYVSLPHAVQHSGGVMGYVAVMAMTVTGPREDHWIAPVHLDGPLGRPVWHREVEQPDRHDDGRLHETDMYYIWAARWAPDGQGGAWIAHRRDDYAILHVAADGTERATLARPYTPPPRDDLARHHAEERLVRKRNARGTVVLADRDPVVHRLRLSDQGDLWVDLSLGGRGPEPGTIAEFDVWTHDGRWTARRRLVGDYDPASDQRLLLDDRHVLVLHTEGDDELRLRLLRIPEPDA
jgi:hypothetical protein